VAAKRIYCLSRSLEDLNFSAKVVGLDFIHPKETWVNESIVVVQASNIADDFTCLYGNRK
jgi:hypothetical protein